MRFAAMLLGAWLAAAAWAQAGWEPSAEQKYRAAATVGRFLALRDQRRYEDAYDMLTPALKQILPFDKFRELEDKFAEQSGGQPQRGSMRLTWYRELPDAQAGVYVEANVPCRYRNIRLCEDVLLLHEQADGRFLVVRQARNFLDRDTERMFPGRPA